MSPPAVSQGYGCSPHRDVAAGLALASALLVGAGLLLRSFQALSAEEAGFSPDGSLAFSLSWAGERYAEAPARIALVHGLLSGFLYGVSPRDPVAIAAAVALTLAVALVAGWLPALRAAHGDPAESLHVQ